MTSLKRLSIIKECFDRLKDKGQPDRYTYYGEPFFVYFSNEIEKQFEYLDNVNDRIILSQLANNKVEVDAIVKGLDLSMKEKARYVALRKNNRELNYTLNFELLKDKYDFLWDEMQLISIDPVVQAQIMSLEDDRLAWFSQLFKHTQTMSTYPAKYVANILSAIGFCPFIENDKQYELFLSRYKKSAPICELLDGYIKENQTLTKKQLDSLVFLLGTNAGVELSCNIQKINELDNLFDEKNSIQRHLSQIIKKESEKKKEKRDAERLKKVIFYKYFGLKYGNGMDCDVPYIVNKFNIEGLKQTKENWHLFEMYRYIDYINDLTSPTDLFDLYRLLDVCDFVPSYFEMTTFENQMRKEYAKQINEQLFSVEGKKNTKIRNATVYDAGTDFVMLVTAVGAYQDLKYVGNYKDYWNSDLIRSHGNCCSLISNSNLATAKQPCVVFGFRDMPQESLLAGNIKDANSTPRNGNYDINFHNRNQSYYAPQEHINHTRDYYNEFNYERIDISQNGTTFKKNPDYIVFFEEFEDYKKELSERKTAKVKEYYDANFNKSNKKERNAKSPLGMLIKNENAIKNKGKSKKEKTSQIDFIDPIEILHEREMQRWEESIKASIQLGVPIVKINRESCAKSEKTKIDETLELLRKTNNSALIKDVIVRYINNYTGLRDDENTHFVLRERYFSKEGFDKLQNDIGDIIIACKDKELQQQMAQTLHDALYDEDSLHTSDKIKYIVSYDEDTLDKLSSLESKLQQ